MATPSHGLYVVRPVRFAHMKTDDRQPTATFAEVVPTSAMKRCTSTVPIALPRAASIAVLP
ncbi:MAG TPA: hypothetical protein VML57_12890 [Burkholderiales bacterium]|nr:hypothetical protein [Burkholderiales bacterium]